MLGDIHNPQGEKLSHAFHPGANSSKKIVVIGHGVTGNMDRPFVVALAEALSEAGIATLRFSFAGNGESEGTFQDCNITKEVSDLGAVLDALSDHEICYIGHSMGGAVGVVRASEDPRIKQLVSLAGMVDTKKFAITEFGDETPDKGLMWEEEDCPLSSTFMNDLTGIGTLVERGTKITVPWLLIHGTEDDVVLIEDSKNIVAKAGDNASLKVIDGANHVFSEPAHLSAMIDHVVGWVK